MDNFLVKLASPFYAERLNILQISLVSLSFKGINIFIFIFRKINIYTNRGRKNKPRKKKRKKKGAALPQFVHF